MTYHDDKDMTYKDTSILILDTHCNLVAIVLPPDLFAVVSYLFENFKDVFWDDSI
jgi:hypothetical protein